MTTRQLVCFVADSCQKKLHIETAKCLLKHVVDTFVTHLKVGKNHFSIHVAIAAFGGHGDDWRKAIPLPLVLVASRLKERHKLFIIKLLGGVDNLKVGNLELLNFCQIMSKTVAIVYYLMSLFSPIAFTTDVKEPPMS